MKMGLLTSILDGWTYEEVIDLAAEYGFQSVEVASWPAGKAERRYAGVSHINAERVLDDPKYAAHVRDYASKKGISISSLAYYPNTMDSDLEKRELAVTHLKNVIRASAALNVGMVTTFIGRDQNRTVEGNLELVGQIWPNILDLARELNVKIAIENCPMLFGPDQWPGGQNLMTTPANWRKVFDLLPYENLGLNFDPSHFVWQMMDYIKPLYEFKDKIFHVHFKDIKVYRDKLDQVGIMAFPLEFMTPKLPGLGDIDWGTFISALTDIGYSGNASIEVEDRAFEGSREKILQSIQLSKQYLSQFTV